MELPGVRSVLADVFGTQEIARSFFGKFVWDVYGFRDLMRRHGAIVCGAGVLDFFNRRFGEGWIHDDSGLQELVVCVGSGQLVENKAGEWVHRLVNIEGMKFIGTVMRVRSEFSISFGVICC